MCSVCLHSPHLRDCPLNDREYECLCEQCGEKIYEDEERWVDNEGNQFCSEECAVKYHRIHKEN